MNLPRLLVFTDRSLCRQSLVDTVAATVHYGARAVVLREKDLPVPARARLRAALLEILTPVGGLLVNASSPTSSGAVHLAVRDEMPTPRPDLVGRSCHDVAEITRASAEGCDYVTVSPIFTTASKPGYGPTLGLDGLSALARNAPPVYALGGVLPEHVAEVRAAGAYGIAVMGPAMKNPAIVSTYMTKLSEVTS